MAAPLTRVPAPAPTDRGRTAALGDVAVRCEALDMVYGQGPTAVPQAALYARDRGQAAALVAAVRGLAERQGGLEALARPEQPSFSAFAQDIDAMAGYAVLFPLMFLTGAVLGVYILLSRLIRAQRTVVGTLLASGVAGPRLARHYLGHGLVTGAVGAAAGALAGIPLGGWFAGEYGRALGLPYSLAGIHPDLIVEGVAAGVVAAGIAAWAPARAAARTSPASAMRASAPAGPGRRSLLEVALPPLRAVPARWRMMLRGLGRSRRRSAFTVAGVMLAIALVMVPVGMRDTISVLLPRQFRDIQREDAQLYAAPGATAQVLDAARADAGVAAAEPISRQDVTIRTGRGHHDTLLYAFQPDTVMHGFPGGLPARGLLLPVSLRGRLGIGPGASVTVDLPATGRELTARVAGFVDEPMGAVAYTSLDQLAAWTGAAGRIAAASGVAVRLTRTGDREMAIRRLGALPGVAAALDTRSLESSIAGAFGLYDTLVLLMGAIGAAMAAALLFNTASASLSERTVELGSLQAAGMGARMLGRLVAFENLLLTVAALVPGLAAGWLLAWGFMAAYQNDQMRLSLQVQPASMPIVALAVLVTAGVAQWIALRPIGRTDIARIVRERST